MTKKNIRKQHFFIGFENPPTVVSTTLWRPVELSNKNHQYMIKL